MQEVRKKNITPAYIIPMVLMIISLSVTIVTYIFIRSTVYVPYINVMTKREQAKMLALGGINIAFSQILKADASSQASHPSTQASREATPGKAAQQQKSDPAKQLLKNVLPALNRAQTYTLTQEKDGISGEIQITIVCEAGKIPINEIYNFETQKFIELGGGAQTAVIPPGGTQAEKKSWANVLKELFKRIEAQTGGKKLFEAFEKFLKTRQYKVNDVTELLTVKEFDVFKHSVWYEAPQQKKERKGEKQRPLYLQDLFTITSSNKIDPWFFSDSIAGVLGLPRAKFEEIKNREKQIEKWAQNFKPTQTWKTEWEKQLKPVYGLDLQNLPKEIEMIFDNTSVPTYFTIISQGTVEQVTQRVIAIIACPQVGSNELPSIYRTYWL